MAAFTSSVTVCVCNSFTILFAKPSFQTFWKRQKNSPSDTKNNWQVWFHYWSVGTSTYILVYCNPKSVVNYKRYGCVKFGKSEKQTSFVLFKRPSDVLRSLCPTTNDLRGFASPVKNLAWLGLVVRHEYLYVYWWFFFRIVFSGAQRNVACVSCGSALLPHRTSLSIHCMLTSILPWYIRQVPCFKTLQLSCYSQPILDCNMSNSRLKHPKLENDKFKLVSEIILFFRIWVIWRERRACSFHTFELLIALTFQIYDNFGLQYIFWTNV